MGFIRNLFSHSAKSDDGVKNHALLEKAVFLCMSDTIKGVLFLKSRYPSVFDTHDDDYLSVAVTFASSLVCWALKRPSLRPEICGEIFRLGGENCPNADRMAFESFKEKKMRIQEFLAESERLGFSVCETIEQDLAYYTVMKLRSTQPDYRGNEFDEVILETNGKALAGLKELFGLIGEVLDKAIPVPPPKEWLEGWIHNV